MTTLDVPCDGRATFHRLGVRGLRDKLLADAKHPAIGDGVWMGDESFTAEAIKTFLRSPAYLARPIGT